MAQLGTAPTGRAEILDPLPFDTGPAPARFSPIDWLVVAAVSTQAEPNDISRLCRVLGALQDGEPNGHGVARMEALGAMAGLIRHCGPRRFASHINCFLEAGFTERHLRLLADSLARPSGDWPGGAGRQWATD